MAKIWNSDIRVFVCFENSEIRVFAFIKILEIIWKKLLRIAE